MAVVKVSILGALRVECDGVDIDLGTEKQRALFASLALRAPHVVSRDRIIDDLWGDVVPASVDSTLAGYVSNLRKVFRQAGVDPSEVIVTRKPGYLLGESVELDIGTFRSLAAADEAVGAAALVSGPTLDDLRHHDFVSRAVEQLDIEVVEAQERAAERRLEDDDWRHVVTYLPELIAVHPFREHLWALYARALYQGGRQADALEALSRARQRLLEDLGLDPGPELKELEDKILRQDPALRTASKEEPTAGVIAPQRSRASASTFGRDRELAVLDRLVEELANGNGGLLLLTGHAGIGKTHLTSELMQRAVSLGLPATRGGASEGSSDPPLYPITEAMANFVRLPLEELRSDVDAANPANAARRSAIGASGVPEASMRDSNDRASIFDTILSTIGDIAVRRPLVIIIEDIHWADEATLLLMERACALAGQVPVLLVSTARLDELAERPEGARFLRSLGRIAELNHLRLRGIGSEASAALVESAGGGSVAPTDIYELLQRSQGNPLFIKEVAGIAGSRGVSVTETAVPETATAAIQQRVDGLAPRTLEVLTSASFAKTWLDPEIDALALGMDPDDVEEHYEIGRAAGMLSIESGRNGSYRFTHALVRAALYERVRPRKRSRMHAALGRAILELHPDDESYLDGAALHLCLGARAGSAVEGIELARRAARTADAAGAPDLAWHHLDRALDAMDFHPDPEPGLRIGLLVERALAAELVGDGMKTEDDFAQAFALADAVGDVELLAWVALQGREGAGTNRTKFWWNPGRAGTDRLSLALERVEATPDPDTGLVAELLSALAADGAPYLGCETALGYAERAANSVIQQRIHDPVVRKSIELETYLSRWDVLTPEELVDAFDSIVASERQAQAVASEVEITARLAACAAQLETGDLQTLPIRMEEGESRSSALPEGSLRWVLTAFHATWLQALDQLDELEALLEAAVELTVGSGLVAAENLVMARAATGLLKGEIEPHARLILDRAVRYRRPNLKAPVAFSLAHGGRSNEARELLASSPWHELSRAEPPTATAIGRVFAMATAALLGMKDETAGLYRELAHLSGRLLISGPGKSFQGPADYYLALAATLLGNDEAVAEHVRVGRAWCERVGNQRFIDRFDDLQNGRTPFV